VGQIVPILLRFDVENAPANMKMQQMIVL